MYGISEAGVHWFAIYQVHHLTNLGMKISSFDPYLLITKEREAFGITSIQTDDTLHLNTNGFIEREEQELQKAGFKAKLCKPFTDSTNHDFNGYRIKVEKDTVTIIQKSQIERFTFVDITAADRI